MKLAVAGKGGVGKTSVTAWVGDYLARSGEDVWLVLPAKEEVYG